MRDRQTDTQTDTQTDRQTDRHTHPHTHTQRNREVKAKLRRWKQLNHGEKQTDR